MVDTDGNWLPEIADENGEIVPTGTWNGYQFPKWRDPEVRTRHEVRDAAMVDELFDQEPRPAFFLLTGYAVDVVDLDSHAATHHGVEDYHERVEQAIGGNQAAVVRTPSDGLHFYISSTGRRGESNTHTQVDYQGAGKLAALPGTRRVLNGAVVEYVVEQAFDASKLDAEVSSLDALLDEYRADARRCEICNEAITRSNQQRASMVPLGDGEGWEIVAENLPPLRIDVNDPLGGVPHTKELANQTLTWTELLSPWFNIVAVREDKVYLIRAEKAAEGRHGHSALLDCATNTLTVWSSDLPLVQNTQLSKLDVYCATKHAASEDAPELPIDNVEALKLLRDSWSALLYQQLDLEVPRHLRRTCADDEISRAPNYPVLSDEFWQAHPILKRIRAEAEPRRASPEAVLTCVLLRVLLHIGHQVVIPPIGGNDPEEGATLNAGAILVAGYGEGKGRAEKVADRYIPSKHMIAAPVSGQAFSLMFGELPPKTPRAAQVAPADPHADPHDPLAQQDNAPKFIRTCWAKYLQYDEMDEFEAQMGMQNSTLSPVLRKVLTEDHLSERFAIGRDSRIPEVEGFRLVFVAHGQPTRLDWLLSGQASGGFPQRLWFVYAAAERPAEEFLDPDYVAPPIDPLELQLPVGWEPCDEIIPNRPKVCVPVPRDARYQVGTWEYECPDDDRRGMLNVRLRAYTALLVLLPGLEQEEVWELATQFHDLCYRTRQYAEKLIVADKQRRTRLVTAAKVEEQRALSLAREADAQTSAQKKCRAAILRVLARGEATMRELRNGMSAGLRDLTRGQLDELIDEGLVTQRDTKYTLS